MKKLFIKFLEKTKHVVCFNFKIKKNLLEVVANSVDALTKMLLCRKQILNRNERDTHTELQ